MPAGPTPARDFDTLVQAHLESAYNLARWLVRDAALADDVVQDAMVRALKYFGGFRGENPRAWLLQIVRNVAFTRLKGSAELTPVDGTAALQVSTDSRDGPEAMVMREDDERVLRKLLAALPVELRECLVMRELEDLSYKEIARIIDAPIGTVMSRLWRGRKLLAEAAGALEVRGS